MRARVIDILAHVVVLEYEDNENNLERRYVSREDIAVNRKNIEIEIDEKVLSIAIEFSDVDLVEYLGKEYLNHPVKELQQALRRVGLWTRTEYLKHPGKIAFVLKKFPGIDVQTIQNATRR